VGELQPGRCRERGGRRRRELGLSGGRGALGPCAGGVAVKGGLAWVEGAAGGGWGRAPPLSRG